jgi:hypothetical protein
MQTNHHLPENTLEKAKNLFQAFCLAAFLSFLPLTYAETEVTSTSSAPSPNSSSASPSLTSSDPITSSLFGEDIVTLSAETAGLCSINNPNDYIYLPQLITIGWQLDEISNEGWNRGNTEFLFSGMFGPVVQGPNPWFAGALFGRSFEAVDALARATVGMRCSFTAASVTAVFASASSFLAHGIVFPHLSLPEKQSLSLSPRKFNHFSDR